MGGPAVCTGLFLDCFFGTGLFGPDLFLTFFFFSCLDFFLTGLFYAGCICIDWNFLSIWCFAALLFVFQKRHF
jgi:hypothetical protein